jgi:hypothetical protein
MQPDIQVDEKVYHYDYLGNLIGMAKVPIENQYVIAAHQLVVGKDGAVYVLIMKRDRGEIHKLGFSPKLPPAFTIIRKREATQVNLLPNTAEDCRTRLSMIDTALEYLNNSINLDSYHIDDPDQQCNGRVKPSYLTTPKKYDSVPYAWNMWDTVGQFNNFMSGGENQKFAGNASSVDKSCGRGIDCSGLVSRAWGLTSKYGTSDLETISDPISFEDLQVGDILNLYGSNSNHTIMFGSYNSDKTIISGYEATVDQNMDQVVSFARSKEFLSKNGYIPRRYNNVCGNTPTPTPTRIPTPDNRRNNLPITQKNSYSNTAALSTPYPLPVQSRYPTPYPYP